MMEELVMTFYCILLDFIYRLTLSERWFEPGELL
jgi:hypothetical protein